VDANHCPGSVMLLFRVPAASSAKASAARCILHTGDMRFDPRMIEPPAPSGGEGGGGCREGGGGGGGGARAGR
jgi:hypothetical protein